jgi:nicotinamidase-related amidase
MSNKDIFINGIGNEILTYIDDLKAKDVVSIESFDPKTTALVIVDVVNGFVKEGALSSGRVAEIVPSVVNLMNLAVSHDIPVVAFADCHTPDSTEFQNFPTHCLEDTSESQLVDEIKRIGNYRLIKKNSTNGYHAPDFKRFLADNPNVENFIVCGDCTDICVLNFCLTLKTAFDQDNKPCNVTIPIDCIETYDAPKHYSELMNIMSLKLMENAGANIVLTIE